MTAAVVMPDGVLLAQRAMFETRMHDRSFDAK